MIFRWFICLTGVTWFSQFAAAASPRWVSLAGRLAGAPAVQALPAKDGSLTFTVNVPGFHAQTEKLREGVYETLSLPDCGPTAEIGEPELPVLRRLVEAPVGATVTLTTRGVPQTMALAQRGVSFPLRPRQPPVPKVRGAREAAAFAINAATYRANQFGPATPVSWTEAGMLAGRRLILIEIRPFSYNPVRAELRTYGQLTVTVKFGGAKAAASTLSAREDAQLAALTVNHSFAPKAPVSGGRLLVIAHDSLATNLTAWVNQKTAFGWTVDLFNTTTAGTTTNAILSFIQARYAALGTRPDMLVLVGDTGLIPRFISVQEDNPDTDLYYACMDGANDWQPEFPVARFSVATLGQLDAVVTKTLAYETAPAAAWMAQAVFMSSEDNYAITESTHNWVIANYLTPRAYTSDKLYSHTYAATPQQVRDAFNAGRVLGIYSGHGDVTYWADGPVFYQSDVNALTNAGKYPFVCSFACLTGQYSQNECFAETWHRTASKGAVNVWASSVYSYWDEDDILEKKLFVALFDDGLRAIGDATFRAKQLYLAYWGATSTTHRYFEQYNLFGDPTVRLAEPLLSIATTSPLPAGFIGESYSTTLAAGGGTQPYTWAITAGALPAGLAFNTNTGTIAGVPVTTGTGVFTAQVTDATAATAAGEFQLPVLTRLQITTASNLPAAVANVPYTTSLQAQGGTAPYSWILLPTGYAETTNTSAWGGGGTAQGWRDDDQSWRLELPWSFPYYGSSHTSVWVCSNGYLDFQASTADYSNSSDTLITNARIAPLWDDLVTTGTGDDIFVSNGVNIVAIRWAAHTYTGSYAVNVEAVLYRDGTIRFNYGAAHTNLTPTIGIAQGDGVSYTLSARDGATTIPAGVGSLFNQTGLLPPGLALTSSGSLTGTPTQAGNFSFRLIATDTGTLLQSRTNNFSLVVAADTDGDQIPDTWEIAHGLNPNDPTDADQDPDGDGQTNRQEYRAGTDPRDSTSRLRVETAAPNGGDFMLTFPTVAGKQYIVERKNALTDPEWTPVDTVLGDGTTRQVIDPNATAQSHRFYRLRLQGW